MPDTEKRAKHWELNHRKIRDAYIQLIKEKQGMPTMSEISTITGLSHSTVQRHLDDLHFEPLKHPLRILTPDVILAIANSARKGSAMSQKLWMQLMEGWVEHHDITTMGNQITMPIDLSNLTKEELKQYVELTRKAERTNPELGSGEVSSG